MRCPHCHHGQTQVKDSRPLDDGLSIRRRRVCLACGGKFTTFERVHLRELHVVKRSGRRVPFDRDKLVRSLEIATRKRGVGAEELEKMVAGIVHALETSGETDVFAHDIGRLVMASLRECDEVAYIRFASVYRNFREANDFQEVVKEMTRQGGEGADGGSQP